MKREFLEALGLDKEVVDKILTENGNDIEREKARTTQAKADLADAQSQLAQRDKDLEELKKSAGDADAIKKQLEDLQSRYDTETERYKTQLAERDYSDAVTRAIAKVTGGVKWTAAAAGREFEASLRQKKLELKDGEIQGAEEFFKVWKEANPDAIAPDKPAPRIVVPIGAGGAPPKAASRAAQLAAEYHKNVYGVTKESEK